MNKRYVAFFNGDEWVVEDRLNDYSVYSDDMDELQAKLIAAIASDIDSADWDDIAADWRWLLYERTRDLKAS